MSQPDKKNRRLLTQTPGCHGGDLIEEGSAMTQANSTARGHARKPRPPKKPRKDFPLTPHPSGLWCKKVLGKLYYFGSWRDDPKGGRALEQWLADKDDRLAGRVPRSKAAAGTPTLGDLVNQFLVSKTALRDAGERSPRTWNAYSDACDELLEAFGASRLLTDLLPEDFQKLRTKWAAKWGPVRLGAEITRVRVVLNFAWKIRLIPAPIHYGEKFDRPSKKVLRLNRAAKGSRMFEADELCRIMAKASQPLATMILLGINAGMGNSDVAKLPLSALDLEGGWMTYPRPKTGIMRRCPLWPETVKAVREWLTQRPAPKDPENFGLLFITVRGNAWDAGTDNRAITHETRKLLDDLSIGGNRNFYALRHTFETIAGESRDQVAVNAIMGHVDPSMAASYRERISDERLRAVAEVVRAWLYAKPKEAAAPRLKIADEGEAASA
jgi:integrase